MSSSSSGTSASKIPVIEPVSDLGKRLLPQKHAVAIHGFQQVLSPEDIRACVTVLESQRPALIAVNAAHSLLALLEPALLWILEDDFVPLAFTVPPKISHNLNTAFVTTSTQSPPTAQLLHIMESYTIAIWHIFMASSAFA